MMKRTHLVTALIALWALTPHATHAQYGTNNINTNANQLNPNLSQNTQVVGGGASSSDSYSVSDGGEASAIAYSDPDAYLNFAPTYNSNYKTRTPPIGMVPPYLPMFNHGGWGTIKGYFSNGPTSDDTAYERMFDPGNKEDMQMLKRLMRSAPYDNFFTAVGGIFTPTLKESKLRGFQVANAVIREKRPDDKPVMLMIDANIDKDLLKRAGYAYVGKISVEGRSTRNWDQSYGSIIAEAIPWDIDVILLSGGMKGITVGNTLSYGAGGGYSQVNYSLAAFGSKSQGITEGRGKPILSAECYRYNPQLTYKRNTPRQFYQMLQTRFAATGLPGQPVAPAATPMYTPTYSSNAALPNGNARGVSQMRSQNIPGVSVDPELAQMAGVRPTQQLIDYSAASPSQ
ncbi:hypothetical protein ACFL6U_11240 [Planctomycetota bacterium]